MGTFEVVTGPVEWSLLRLRAEVLDRVLALSGEPALGDGGWTNALISTMAATAGTKTSACTFVQAVEPDPGRDTTV